MPPQGPQGSRPMPPQGPQGQKPAPQVQPSAPQGPKPQAPPAAQTPPAQPGWGIDEPAPEPTNAWNADAGPRESTDGWAPLSGSEHDDLTPVPYDDHPKFGTDEDEPADDRAGQTHEYYDAGQDDLLPVPMDTSQLPPELREIKMQAQDALIERMGARLYDRSLAEDQLEGLVLVELNGFLYEEDLNLTEDERRALTRELINDVLHHGPIEPFLEEEDITEIMVNGLAPIFVERGGRLTQTTSQFLTEAHLRQVIDRIVSKIGRRIDESSPMVDARLPDGSRVNAVVPPLAVDGPSLTIRKFAKEALTVKDLIGFGTLSNSSVAFLSACVRGRLNVLVSGGTGTGKTTLLNCLSNFIPNDERIITIEDAVELQLKQNHIVRLESRPPNVEGKGAVHIRDLVRNSLRMRPDRVIIGECRGGEALDMLQAMNTGHDGSLSTLHANGPRDALARLETLCLMAGMDLPIRAIREQIASAVHLVVHVARLRDGSRRVTHIAELVGMEGEHLTMSDLFTFDFDAGFDIEGRYAGELRSTGLRPLVLDHLSEHGVTIDPTLFSPHNTALTSGGPA